MMPKRHLITNFYQLQSLLQHMLPIILVTLYVLYVHFFPFSLQYALTQKCVCLPTYLVSSNLRLSSTNLYSNINFQLNLNQIIRIKQRHKGLLNNNLYILSNGKAAENFTNRKCKKILLILSLGSSFRDLFVNRCKWRSLINTLLRFIHKQLQR